MSIDELTTRVSKRFAENAESAKKEPAAPGKGSDLKLRTATVRDAEAICEIYAPYVENTAVTFEYEAPSVAEFVDRISAVLKKYPFLVAEISGKIVGFSYAGPFRERPAYDHSAEITIYLPAGQRRQGIGRALYEATEKILAAQHVNNVYACIAVPSGDEADEHISLDSVRFHEHMGYKIVGSFHRCGYKFGRWYSMVWMEKIIGEYAEEQLPFQIYRAVEGNVSF